MVNLLRYVGKGARTGANEQIWVQIAVFLHVGNGKYTKLSSKNVKLSGDIDINILNVLKYKGPLSVSVTVISDNTMSITINDLTDGKARYKVKGNQLIVNVRFPGALAFIKQIAASQVGNQTYLSLSGTVPTAIHIAPGPR